MEQYPFLFSDEPKHRLKRHVFFWLSWWIFSALLYSFSGAILRFDYLKRLPMAAVESFFYLLPQMLLAYSLLYVVIPHQLLKGKYRQTVASVVLLFLLTAVIGSSIGNFVLKPLRYAILDISVHSYTYEANFNLGILAGLRGGITIAGLAAAIKLTKHWYAEGQRNLRLQKENADAQLQLLKAQVHPHFLFNTLNNIYSLSQTTSPAAANMVMSLSDILRYMLYEGNRTTTPLDSELKMIDDYLALEKIRYGDRLELHVSLPDNTEGFAIAPLLLLPLVENCFKHGISNVVDQPWLTMTVSLEENVLAVKLLNSKPPSPSTTNHTGIGLENVRQRLALLYPGKHQFSVADERDVFIVNLKLELVRSAILRKQPGQPLPLVMTN